MVELRKRYYNGIQIVDVLNKHIDRPETIMNCLNNFSNLEVDDAVEVVRCKDCKHWHDPDENKWGACYEWGGYSQENDYCSWGERREDDGIH